jgi:hypothetical protein
MKSPDLSLKLHGVVAETLTFDGVPAIRGPLPIGISDGHFLSDLSALPTLTVQPLIDRAPSSGTFCLARCKRRGTARLKLDTTERDPAFGLEPGGQHRSRGYVYNPRR